MKATGIVRRIDDLGRVVIPKEIRRTLRIREGDPLEIYTERDGEVIFKKYSPMGDLTELASQICESISKNTGHIAVISDRDSIIAVSGASSLSEALVFVGTAPYRRNEMDENFRRIQRVYLSSHDIRRFGCTALELCYIACGRADGQFEFGTKPWDIAAGWLILREAGGEVVSVWGGPPPLDGESAIVSTNGRFTEELRALM